MNISLLIFLYVEVVRMISVLKCYTQHLVCYMRPFLCFMRRFAGMDVSSVIRWVNRALLYILLLITTRVYFDTLYRAWRLSRCIFKRNNVSAFVCCFCNCDSSLALVSELVCMSMTLLTYFMLRAFSMNSAFVCFAWYRGCCVCLVMAFFGMMWATVEVLRDYYQKSFIHWFTTRDALDA